MEIKITAEEIAEKFGIPRDAEHDVDGIVFKASFASLESYEAAQVSVVR